MSRTNSLRAAATALFIAAAAMFALPAAATSGSDHKPGICHPVEEGKGETGYGWNLISPDKASKHIDEATGAGKHTRKDGRTDVYAVDGICPGGPTPTPSETPTEPEPSQTPEPTPTETTPDPTPSETPTETPTSTPTPSVTPSSSPTPSETPTPEPTPSETTTPTPTPSETETPEPTPSETTPSGSPTPSETTPATTTTTPAGTTPPAVTATPETPLPQLAQTGANLWPAALGFGLVAVGALALWTSRTPGAHQ